MWAVGGGKGGVGKSLVSICIAFWLGRMKHRVVLVDADLGGANLHTMLGIRVPDATLEDFMLRRADTLEEVLIPTSHPNVRLLAGGSDIPSLANPNFGQKTRILRAMNDLEADYIIVDLGAGTSLNTLDFFLAAPERLAVLIPQPTSIQNTYGFIKAALYRRIGRILKKTALEGLLEGPGARGGPPIPQSVDEILEDVSIRAPQALNAVRDAIVDLKVRLVVNMVRNARDEKVSEVIRGVCRRYLGVEIELAGSLPYDPSLERWASRMEHGTFGREGLGGAFHKAYDIAFSVMGDLQRKAG